MQDWIAECTIRFGLVSLDSLSPSSLWLLWCSPFTRAGIQHETRAKLISKLDIEVIYFPD
ncbi:hypothetical protein AAMO2058_001699000 [Amorphochlora amoebiformis]